jgi:hypothetical protein
VIDRPCRQQRLLRMEQLLDDEQVTVAQHDPSLTVNA